MKKISLEESKLWNFSGKHQNSFDFTGTNDTWPRFWTGHGKSALECFCGRVWREEKSMAQICSFMTQEMSRSSQVTAMSKYLFFNESKEYAKCVNRNLNRLATFKAIIAFSYH